MRNRPRLLALLFLAGPLAAPARADKTRADIAKEAVSAMGKFCREIKVGWKILDDGDRALAKAYDDTGKATAAAMTDDADLVIFPDAKKPDMRTQTTQMRQLCKELMDPASGLPMLERSDARLDAVTDWNSMVEELGALLVSFRGYSLLQDVRDISQPAHHYGTAYGADPKRELKRPDPKDKRAFQHYANVRTTQLLQLREDSIQRLLAVVERGTLKKAVEQAKPPAAPGPSPKP